MLTRRLAVAFAPLAALAALAIESRLPAAAAQRDPWNTKYLVHYVYHDIYHDNVPARFLCFGYSFAVAEAFSDAPIGTVVGIHNVGDNPLNILGFNNTDRTLVSLPGDDLLEFIRLPDGWYQLMGGPPMPEDVPDFNRPDHPNRVSARSDLLRELGNVVRRR